MKFELLPFLMYLIETFFEKSRYGAKARNVPAKKRYFQELCNTFRKTLLAEFCLVNVLLKLRLAFLFKKRRLSQIIIEAAVRKCS